MSLYVLADAVGSVSHVADQGARGRKLVENYF